MQFLLRMIPRLLAGWTLTLMYSFDWHIFHPPACFRQQHYRQLLSTDYTTLMAG